MFLFSLLEMYLVLDVFFFDVALEAEEAGLPSLFVNAEDVLRLVKPLGCFLSASVSSDDVTAAVASPEEPFLVGFFPEFFRFKLWPRLLKKYVRLNNYKAYMD